MKREPMGQMSRSHGAAHYLTLLVGLSCCQFGAISSAVAQQQEAVKTAPEPAPQQPPLNNWYNVTTPGVRALARPGSFPEYGPYPGCISCPGHKNGSCIHRLIEWATYRPQNRVCACTSCCNSCQYKGVIHPYLFFLNPKCYPGTGLRETTCNQCYRGCKDCGNCAPAGHSNNCADSAAVGHP
jgi:hypothetical protein